MASTHGGNALRSLTMTCLTSWTNRKTANRRHVFCSAPIQRRRQSESHKVNIGGTRVCRSRCWSWQSCPAKNEVASIQIERKAHAVTVCLTPLDPHARIVLKTQGMADAHPTKTYVEVAPEDTTFVNKDVLPPGDTTVFRCRKLWKRNCACRRKPCRRQGQTATQGCVLCTRQGHRQF